MDRRLARLAALGAIAVALGVAALYALLVYITIPAPAAGGIDWEHSRITWIALGIVAAAIVAPHLVYARMLLRVVGSGKREAGSEEHQHPAISGQPAAHSDEGPLTGRPSATSGERSARRGGSSPHA